MKSGIICGALLSGINAVEVGEKAVDDAKRYFQLTEMMTHYNPDFDERKYWSYGCHCFVIGDRPMSDMGHGVPIDPLDKVCKKYKECLKCAREEYGEECIGEFVKYKYGISGPDVVCKDNPIRSSEHGCKRKLCECDAMFAREHAPVADIYNKDYNVFYTTVGWTQDQCTTPPGDRDPECCGTKTMPSILYNANRFECCSGNDVKPLGQC